MVLKIIVDQTNPICWLGGQGFILNNIKKNIMNKFKTTWI
jgi:hypothetical protein